MVSTFIFMLMILACATHTHPAAAYHLIVPLKQQYEVAEDWSGARFCGITLEWDYRKRTVDLSMPRYVQNALKRFNHRPPSKPCYSPHPAVPIQYGQKVQYAQPSTQQSTALPENIKLCQQVVGVFLYYARAVDCTMLLALNSISEAQTNPSQQTMNNVSQLLDYAYTRPNAKIRYKASNMQLWIDSDAAYLVAPKARSRVAGYYYLSDVPQKPLQKDPTFNGPIHVECKLLRFVQSSSAEAEIGGLFHNMKQACPIRTTLQEMGHVQHITPVKTDNSTAYKFAINDIKHRLAKHMDMRYHWILDKKDIYEVYWRYGIDNYADYFSKHHLDIVHRRARPKYLQPN